MHAYIYIYIYIYIHKYIFRLMSTITRRLKGDMLEVFKILNGYDNIGREHSFVYSKSNLRGHIKKLFKPRCRL